MKKLIFLELTLLFLATTFSSSPPPPGWYQQTLPVIDFVNDIFFLDSLNGWAVTDHQGGSDTSYIMRTTNGGDNWEINYNTFVQFTAIQFVDSAIGYACGIGPGPELFKSTNGGNSWNILNVLTFTWKSDLQFINKDTGWVCSTDPFDGGLFKTTDGGLSWQRQLDATYKPDIIFFINKDTGWVNSDVADGRLYRTINGGLNWNLQFSSAFPIEAVFFLNGNKGWIRGGPDLTGNGVSYTTDGGFTWTSSTGNTAAGFDIMFVNDSIGYTGLQSFRIPKSTDGGKTWGYQTSPIGNTMSISVLGSDTLNGWAGGTGIVHTEDGGGFIVNVGESSGIEIPENYKLSQNYPNPFNPKTVISYELRVTDFVKISVYNIAGKEISTLVNQRQSAGNYKVDFNGEGLTSGIYFYRIEILNEELNEIFNETKKMILIK